VQGTSTVTAVGTIKRHAAGTLSGIGALAGVGRLSIAEPGSISGSSVVTGVGEARFTPERLNINIRTTLEREYIDVTLIKYDIGIELEAQAITITTEIQSVSLV
jgi:hypothetical protein